MTELAAITSPTAQVTLVGETSLADLKTRPDYSVTIGAGKLKALVGFIEVKAPGKGFDPRKFKDEHDKTQWAKLKALPNLLYTDGNGFSLWRNGELVGRPVPLDGDVETSGAKLGAPNALLPLIGDFLAWQPVAPKGPQELAATAARLCRFLRDEVLEQMGEGATPLLGLARDWRTLLFPNANDAQFADGYAQAVTFGLLMAKSLGLLMAKSLGLPLDGDLDAVAKKLGQTNTLIGTALRILTEQPETLQTSLGTMTRVLDVVDWAKVSKGDGEAWLYFYEQFLEVYDNRLRKLTGSYYTPPQVVQAMVRLCDEALKSPGRFAIHAGLASPQVHIADPAMGSGTFLLALIRHIAEAIAKDQGQGAVGPALTAAAKRLYGFELQFGAFAVAQLRLLAETLELKASEPPRLFVTDTLGDPHEHEETGTGIGRLLSHSRVEANRVKAEQPITVVIGNPPYKEKAKGRGSWIENGSAARPIPVLDDWQPPKEWKAGAHAKHLRNLYVYFWRWAAWKVFEQGSGGRHREPPVPEQLSGMVCYITVAGFLNGPGFQKMRADLRRDCDDIWVIDCSPEGHQPEVATRIFEGVQHPVCIVLASRSPDNDPGVPAKVRYRSLKAGHRKQKFDELAALSLASPGWVECAVQPRAPFLPEFVGGWADFVPLDTMLGDGGSGVMPGRTWIIAPDIESLAQRWAKLIGEKDAAQRAAIFHPHEGGDRTVGKSSDGLPPQEPVQSIELGLTNRASKDDEERGKAGAALRLRDPVRYGFRSFDRQWIIPDKRLINRPNPNLWKASGKEQIYLSGLMAHSPTAGPALSATALIPDLHQYKGSFGGRVFPLWRDAAAAQTNVSDGIIAALTKTYGSAPDPADVFAYVAALLACPAYTERFRADLVRPGLRVPLTADRRLFRVAAAIGRKVIWLHTFGERFARNRPAGPPRLPLARRPTIPAEGAIPSTPEGFPTRSATIPASAG
ncbi:MAG TPA: type ISP restriction/modification enzyme [Allosphingosinicella sp.]